MSTLLPKDKTNDRYNIPVIFINMNKPTIRSVTNKSKGSKTCTTDTVLLRDNIFSTIQLFFQFWIMFVNQIKCPLIELIFLQGGELTSSHHFLPRKALLSLTYTRYFQKGGSNSSSNTSCLAVVIYLLSFFSLRRCIVCPALFFAPSNFS